jgi:hypothetical protein
MLAETARVAGLERELRRALGPWTRRRAVHDPARVIVQLAYALALGGDCLADIALLRDATVIVGGVPSDPTVSRVIDGLAGGGADVLDAIAVAHGSARAAVHAARGGPRGSGLVLVDIDPTIVVAHSDKEWAAPTFKRSFGHHPVLAFCDHGDGGHRGGVGRAAAPGKRPGPGTTPPARQPANNHAQCGVTNKSVSGRPHGQDHESSRLERLRRAEE